MENVQIIILAAGHGKRMNNNELPKVLVSLKGKPIIKKILDFFYFGFNIPYLLIDRVLL